MSIINKFTPISKETMLKEIEKVKQNERAIYSKQIEHLQRIYEKQIEKQEKELSQFRIFLNRLPEYYRMMFYVENHISIEASKRIL